MVLKLCKHCGKRLDVDVDDKTCICYNCGCVMTVTKTLSSGKGGSNRHGIRLWASKKRKC